MTKWKNYLFAAVAGAMLAGAAVAAVPYWTPSSPVAGTLAGAYYNPVYPPAAGTTSTFMQVGLLSSYTIATLPTCSSSNEGLRVFVTNGATSPTYLASVSTTGTVVVPVFCNGSGWVYN